MPFHPKAVVAILGYVKETIPSNPFNYSQNLLRLKEREMPRDMFELKIKKYLKKEKKEEIPDIILIYFDFDGFSRDYLKGEPDKYIILAAIAKWALQSIDASFSNKILIKALRYNPFSGRAQLTVELHIL